MMEILQRCDILSGFVTFNQTTHTASLGVKFKDVDDYGTHLIDLPSIPSMVSYSTLDELDQSFDMETGLRIAMSDADFVQTKGLHSLRDVIAAELGYSFESNKVFKKVRTD